MHIDCICFCSQTNEPIFLVILWSERNYLLRPLVGWNDIIIFAYSCIGIASRVREAIDLTRTALMIAWGSSLSLQKLTLYYNTHVYSISSVTALSPIVLWLMPYTVGLCTHSRACCSMRVVYTDWKSDIVYRGIVFFFLLYQNFN